MDNVVMTEMSQATSRNSSRNHSGTLALTTDLTRAPAMGIIDKVSPGSFAKPYSRNNSH